MILMFDDRMWVRRGRCLLGEHREAGKLQQEFFHAYVGELHRGLGVISLPRECHDLASSGSAGAPPAILRGSILRQGRRLVDERRAAHVRRWSVRSRGAASCHPRAEVAGACAARADRRQARVGAAA